MPYLQRPSSNTNPWRLKRKFPDASPKMEAICEDWCPCQSQFLLKTKNAQQMCCPKWSPKRQRSNLDLFWKKFYYVKNHQKISHVNWIVWIFRQNVPVCQNKRLLKKATFSCPFKVMKTCPTSVKKVGNANKSILSRNGMQQKWL